MPLDQGRCEVVSTYGEELQITARDWFTGSYAACLDYMRAHDVPDGSDSWDIINLTTKRFVSWVL